MAHCCCVWPFPTFRCHHFCEQTYTMVNGSAFSCDQTSTWWTQGEKTRSIYPQASVLVVMCGKDLCDLTPQTREAGRVLSSPHPVASSLIFFIWHSLLSPFSLSLVSCPAFLLLLLPAAGSLYCPSLYVWLWAPQEIVYVSVYWNAYSCQ